jgi:UDP-glucose 4-epimerase
VRLVVTGGAGYIGSVVTQHLLEAGHEVLVVDDLSTGHEDAVPRGAELVVGDIRGLTGLLEGRGRYDGVLHFAAKSLVGESGSNPAVYWDNNVGGSLAVLVAMRDLGISKLVFSSTAATYGQPEESPIREDVPTNPTNAYGATKLAVDHMISSFSAAHGLGAVSLRYFNVAGAYAGLGERHTTETHLIPLALQVASGTRERLAVYGDDYPTRDGTCIRDYLHVADLADAHLLALGHAEPGRHDVLNLGNGNGFSVQEVITTVREVTGHPLPAVVEGRRAGDPASLVASSELAQKTLGWSPRRPDVAEMVRDAWDLVKPA